MVKHQMSIYFQGAFGTWGLEVKNCENGFVVIAAGEHVVETLPAQWWCRRKYGCGRREVLQGKWRKRTQTASRNLIHWSRATGV